MTRGVKVDFVLRATDEPYLLKVPARLVDALRKVHTGVGYPQAAVDLGIPLGTVKSRVNRARVAVLRMRATEGQSNVEA